MRTRRSRPPARLPSRNFGVCAGQPVRLGAQVTNPLVLVTGAFMFAPLHAVKIHDGAQQVSCADYVVSSSTPTAIAVLRPPVAASYSMAHEFRLAAFAAEVTRDATLPRLHHAEVEVDAIACIPDEKRPAVDAVATVVHLACHSVQDAGNTLASGFCLHNGRLTVVQLMKGGG
jgi:hypothetical protein